MSNQIIYKNSVYPSQRTQSRIQHKDQLINAVYTNRCLLRESHETHTLKFTVLQNQDLY